jgi:hypothetical protein
MLIRAALILARDRDLPPRYPKYTAAGFFLLTIRAILRIALN